MEELIKINQVINTCLNYKAILLTSDNCININFYLFNKDTVNENGIFIGQKYRKFLYFFKVYTYEYERYIWAIQDIPVTMSYTEGDTIHLSAYIENVLKSAMELEAYKNDAKELMEKFEMAWENLKKQYEILDNLKRINNIE